MHPLWREDIRRARRDAVMAIVIIVIMLAVLLVRPADPVLRLGASIGILSACVLAWRVADTLTLVARAMNAYLRAADDPALLAELARMAEMDRRDWDAPEKAKPPTV